MTNSLNLPAVFRVFISYRRAESSMVAGRIYDRLVARFGEGTVFRDIYNLSPGADFSDDILKRVSVCDILLVIIGTHWANDKRLHDPNDWVRMEIEWGFRLKKLIIPVLTNGARLPGRNQIPEALHDLLRRQAIAVRDDPDFPSDVQCLIEALERGGPPLVSLPATKYRPTMIRVPGSEIHTDMQNDVGLPLDYDLYVGQTLVTQAQWTALIGENPSHFQGYNQHWDILGGPDHPVEYVSWFDTLSYLNQLSQIEGLEPAYGIHSDATSNSGSCAKDIKYPGKRCEGFRLPSHDEWITAARAGDTGLRYGEPIDIAWYCDNHGIGTNPVAQKKPNPFGLYDMLGNVNEWTNSEFISRGISADWTQVPDRLMVCGGDWATREEFIRYDYCDFREPSMRDFTVGFRPARIAKSGWFGRFCE